MKSLLTQTEFHSSLATQKPGLLFLPMMVCPVVYTSSRLHMIPNLCMIFVYQRRMSLLRRLLLLRIFLLQELNNIMFLISMGEYGRIVQRLPQ